MFYLFLQPVVVEPSELKNKDEQYRKSSRKSRRSSSSASSSKKESFSKHSEDISTSSKTNDSSERAQEKLTQNEKLAIEDVQDDPEYIDGSNDPNKKGIIIILIMT